MHRLERQRRRANTSETNKKNRKPVNKNKIEAVNSRFSLRQLSGPKRRRRRRNGASAKAKGAKNRKPSSRGYNRTSGAHKRATTERNGVFFPVEESLRTKIPLVAGVAMWRRWRRCGARWTKWWWLFSECVNSVKEIKWKTKARELVYVANKTWTWRRRGWKNCDGW